mmetsp:Transcript_25346/g.47141  ORF Transcript_25346/g.47141 Transcript_25346/m.47141 type:complete len:473 (-) Transcript_25346:553-1971(-)
MTLLDRVPSLVDHPLLQVSRVELLEVRLLQGYHVHLRRGVVLRLPDEPLLLVVLLLGLVRRIEVLQVLRVEESGQDERSERDEDRQQCRVDVPERRELSDSEDGTRAHDLHEREQLDSPPLHFPDHGNRRPLLGQDEAKRDALPNLVPVQRSHPQVQKEAEQTSPRNPAQDREGAECDEHEQALPQSRPPLLLAVRHHLPRHTVPVRLELARAQRPGVQRSLRNESVPRRQPQNRARQERQPDDEEIPVIRRGLLQVVLGTLRQDRRHVVIDDEEEEEHETRDHGREDAVGADAVDGVDDPGTVGRRLPVPGREPDVDAVQAARSVVRLVDAGNERDGRDRHHGDGRVVAGQERPNVSGEERPRLGEVQTPRDAEGEQSEQHRRVLRPPVGTGVSVSQRQGLDEIPERRVQERDGDEELEDLGGERRHGPHERHQPDDRGYAVHQSRPEARPEEERKVLGVELLGQPIGRPQ